MSGTKSDSPTIEARRDRLLELLAEGKSQVDCVEILEGEGYPVSRMTLWRDIQSLKVTWQQHNSESWEKMREQQLAVLEKMESAILNQTMAPQEVAVWRQVRKDIADLAGLDAPSKSISQHITTEEPDWIVEFRRASQGLLEEDFAQIWEFMRLLPRKARVIDASMLPPKELPA